ncbi:MAG TPA: hypothetical protein VF881_05770 [Polyangiaceae bacterium]
MQQSLDCAQLAPKPWQVLVGNAHRPRVASHVPLQQTMLVEPAPQASPAGWHSSASSPTLRHSRVDESQMNEQHSELAAQAAP